MLTSNVIFGRVRDRHVDDSTLVYCGGPSWTTETSVDVVTDKVTKDNYKPYGRGVWPYGEFESVTTESIGFPSSYEHYSCPYHPNGDMWVGKCWGSLALNHTGTVDSDGQVDVAGMLSQLGGRVDSRLPSLRPDVDLFVFIVELADIKELCSFFGTLGAGLLKDLANTDLMYHFALKPLYDEVPKIYDLLRGVGKRYTELIEGAGKVHDLKTAVTRTAVIDEHPVGSLSNMGCIPPDGVCPHTGELADERFRSEEATLRASATVKYRYQFPKDYIGAKAHRYLIELGLAPELDSLWELVPFSFVVDWFFNTERALSALGLDNLGGDVQTEIIDCCVTLHEQYVSSERFSRWCHGGVSPSSGRAKYTLTRTSRVAGADAWKLLQGPWFTMPGFLQLHLGASLLIGLKK